MGTMDGRGANEIPGKVFCANAPWLERPGIDVAPIPNGEGTDLGGGRGGVLATSFPLFKTKTPSKEFSDLSLGMR